MIDRRRCAGYRVCPKKHPGLPPYTAPQSAEKGNRIPDQPWLANKIDKSVTEEGMHYD